MLKLGCGAVALLSLLASGAILWTTGALHASPSGLGGWAAAWLHAFRDPALSLMLFALCALLVAAAASVTELLLALLFSVLAALASLLCLLGVLGAHSPGVAEWVTRMAG